MLASAGAALLGVVGSPLGRLGLAVVAFLLWTTWQRHDAARDARAECDAAQLRVTVQELRRQNDVYAEALRQAGADVHKNRSETERLQETIDELVAEASDGPCDFDDATLDRLRGIK